MLMELPLSLFLSESMRAAIIPVTAVAMVNARQPSPGPLFFPPPSPLPPSRPAGRLLLLLLLQLLHGAFVGEHGGDGGEDLVVGDPLGVRRVPHSGREEETDIRTSS